MAPKKKLRINEMVKHVLNMADSYERQRESRLKGYPVNYGKSPAKKKARSQKDYQPPEYPMALKNPNPPSPKKKEKQPHKKKAVAKAVAKAKKPTSPLKKAAAKGVPKKKKLRGIRYGVKSIIRNTCNLDCCIMAFLIPHTAGILFQPYPFLAAGNSENLMKKSFAMMEKYPGGDGDDVRKMWARQWFNKVIPRVYGGEPIDLYNDMSTYWNNKDGKPVNIQNYLDHPLGETMGMKLVHTLQCSLGDECPGKQMNGTDQVIKDVIMKIELTSEEISLTGSMARIATDSQKEYKGRACQHCTEKVGHTGETGVMTVLKTVPDYQHTILFSCNGLHHLEDLPQNI